MPRFTDHQRAVFASRYSLGELEGAHLALEDISIRLTKEWEDRRIGGSPIEKSTRYVFFDAPGADGLPRYHRPAGVMASKHAAFYVETMDAIFGIYRSLVEPMSTRFRCLHPIAYAEYDINDDGRNERWNALTGKKQRDAFVRTYRDDIRTQACDALRALLPLATTTNVGIFGNGRFFRRALSHGLSHPLAEAQDVAKAAHAELSKVIPKYVKRAKPNAYLMQVRERMRALATRIFEGIAPEAAPSVRLLDRGEHAIARTAGHLPLSGELLHALLNHEQDHLTLALMLYPHLTHPLQQIRDVVRDLSGETKREIRETYLGDRANRRDRPGRALESGYAYTFDNATDFGTYKDLERHRMLTQGVQAFTPTLGFSMPPQLVAAGFEEKGKAVLALAKALYERLLPDFPDDASYAALHGSHVRWTMGANDRELMRMFEHCTQRDGHASYRKACQDMHTAVKTRSVWRADAMKFVDYAEARQRAKEAKLDEPKP